MGRHRHTEQRLQFFHRGEKEGREKLIIYEQLYMNTEMLPTGIFQCVGEKKGKRENASQIGLEKGISWEGGPRGQSWAGA